MCVLMKFGSEGRIVMELSCIDAECVGEILKFVEEGYDQMLDCDGMKLYVGL